LFEALSVAGSANLFSLLGECWIGKLSVDSLLHLIRLFGIIVHYLTLVQGLTLAWDDLLRGRHIFFLASKTDIQLGGIVKLGKGLDLVALEHLNFFDSLGLNHILDE
jgi:hypothetical protein